MTEYLIKKLIPTIDSYLSSITEEPRNYIGASSIGSDCMRKIWYEYKGSRGEKVEPRIRRIFDTGKTLEAMLLDYLIKCNLNLLFDFPFQDKENDLFKGHVDAVILDQETSEMLAILEIKSVKASEFSKLVKDSLRIWNLQYYSQIQAYLGMSGLPVAFLLAINKDTSELYEEEILPSELFYEGLYLKAQMVMNSEIEPARVSNNPAWFVCKQCKFRKICHE